MNDEMHPFRRQGLVRADCHVTVVDVYLLLATTAQGHSGVNSLVDSHGGDRNLPQYELW